MIADLPVQLEGGSALAFAPGTDTLYYEDAGGVIRRFTPDTDQLTALARSMLTREFTADECARYFPDEDVPDVRRVSPRSVPRWALRRRRQGPVSTSVSPSRSSTVTVSAEWPLRLSGDGTFSWKWMQTPAFAFVPNVSPSSFIEPRAPAAVHQR